MEFQQIDFNSGQIVTKKKWFKRPIFYVGAVVLAVVIYLVYNFSSAYQTIVVDNGRTWTDVVKGGKASPKDDELYPMPKKEDSRFDVLILGIRGEDDIQNGGLLSDSIELFSFDQKTKKSSLISIPRDTYIEMLGIKGKVNEVYTLGYEKNAGIALTSQVISRLTGIYIDKTVVFNFDAFREVVDGLGGIDVHLNKEFKESSQWGYPFVLPAGDNHLNGEQALYYVRSRYSTNDFDRARRQQDVMLAIKKKVVSAGLLANPFKVSSLLSSIKNNIRTDFQVWDASSLITLANSLDSGTSGIKRYVISTENIMDQTKDDIFGYILVPKGGNFDKFKELFKTILN